jgi:hypothetical protein
MTYKKWQAMLLRQRANCTAIIGINSNARVILTK